MTKCKIVSCLFKIKAIKINLLEPFLYASGLNGPIYCDNRLIWSYLNEREIILEALRLEFKQNHNSEKSDDFENKMKGKLKILGLATGGIAHGMWLADKFQLPFGYIRSNSKNHGKQKLMEGHFLKGDEVILVEDLVNQGSSLEKVVMHLEQQEINFKKCFCIVNYQTQNSKEIEKKYKIKIHSLVGFSDIVDYVVENNLFSKLEIDSLIRWQNNPETWTTK